MSTVEQFARIQGDFNAILKLLHSEEQKYEPGDEDILLRLYRVAWYFSGRPTEEMCESVDYVNMILQLIKLALHQKDPDDLCKKLFQFMEECKVGYRCAKRYQKEAAWLLHNNKGEKALQLLKEGLRRGAQPEDILQNCIKAHTEQAVQRSPTPTHSPGCVLVTRSHPSRQVDHGKHSPQAPTDRGKHSPRAPTDHALAPDVEPHHKATSSSDPGHARLDEARDHCDESYSSESDLEDDESHHTQLSPINEHVASDANMVAAGRPRVPSTLAPTSVAMARSGQWTPRDTPVMGALQPGSITPQQHLQTPAHDYKAQTPANERHVVYVNERPYTKIKVIGRGGSCKVYKVTGPDNDIYALKRVCAARKAFDSFRNEVNLLKQLRGKANIIQMIDYEIDEPNGRISIVLEYGEYDFANYLMSDPLLGIDEICGFWKGMLLAVQDIHEARIVHSDLKPQNYMLVQGKLKLIDFGIAKDIPNDTTNIQRDQTYGTLSYMAPEANARCGGAPVKLGRSSDIWSLGIILYQLVYKRPPFEHLTPLQRYLTLSDPNTNIEFRGLTDDDVPNSNEEDRRNLVRVLQSCLLYNPRERFTIPQLLSHPLLFPRLESAKLNCSSEYLFANVKSLLTVLRGCAQQSSPGGDPTSSSSADILEDQVCATFCSNILYERTECDNGPLKRFAKLCFDSNASVRSFERSSGSKTSPEDGPAQRSKQAFSPVDVDFRNAEEPAKFVAQRVLRKDPPD